MFFLSRIGCARYISISAHPTPKNLDFVTNPSANSTLILSHFRILSTIFFRHFFFFAAYFELSARFAPISFFDFIRLPPATRRGVPSCYFDSLPACAGRGNLPRTDRSFYCSASFSDLPGATHLQPFFLPSSRVLRPSDLLPFCSYFFPIPSLFRSYFVPIPSGLFLFLTILPIILLLFPYLFLI